MGTSNILVFLAAILLNSVEAVLPKTFFGTLLDGFPSNLTARDQWSGTKHVIVHRFGVMDQPSWYDWVFSEMLANWNNGRITHFSWDPCNVSCNMPGPDSALQVTQGVFDTSINNFISRLSKFLQGPDGKLGTADDRRMFLRWAHELNGDWYVFSQNSTNYIAAWKYVWNKFAAAGFTSTQVQWVWEPIAPAVSGDYAKLAERWYPGDAYVDWFSLDGYNWARSVSWGQAWYDPWEIYDGMLYKLRDINPTKPVMISEVGCSAKGASVERKNKWLIDWYKYALDQNIQIVVYFDTFADNADWWAFGASNGTSQVKSPVDNITRWVFSGYATSAASYSYKLTNASSPRLLTDDEFFGRMAGYKSTPATPRPMIIFDDSTKYDCGLARAPAAFSIVSSPVYSGTASIAMNCTPWDSLQLQTPGLGFNTSHYYAIQFWLNVGTVANKSLSLRFYDVAGTDVGRGVRLDGLYNLPASRWVQVTLPWTFWSSNATLSGVGIRAKGFYLQSASNTAQGLIYLDNVQLLSKPVRWAWNVTTSPSTFAIGPESPTENAPTEPIRENPVTGSGVVARGVLSFYLLAAITIFTW